MCIPKTSIRITKYEISSLDKQIFIFNLPWLGVWSTPNTDILWYIKLKDHECLLALYPQGDQTFLILPNSRSEISFSRSGILS